MLQASSTDLGISGGNLPCGPVEQTTLGTRSPLGSTSTNGTPSTVLGDQSGKTSRSGSESASSEHPARADDRGRLAQVERPILALLGEKRQQVVDAGGRHLLLETLRA